ncbi:DNA primase [Salinarchaeum sp. IM2453]|uniref:DNA primase DnaG n=1 Tax=Salinarchaeum sp. IM2453 TaxID=2862870 RepID=UPI001C82C14C|nr:DNA primase DnaG [Salinarchaeum sp. IM2453]QZA88853.1 DNA primase [Salinarchaeum sp. IM2453]
MQHTGKYLIHARIEADGVVERSDVVGAIFGQTEGLLGKELELRNLQNASKVGRIDVEIDSNQGRSVGEVTIGTTLDRVETATVAAALETITRIGPCEASVTVTEIEDVRAAKRKEVVDRAHELLIESFDGGMTGEEIIEEVRRRVRKDEITTYKGLPAGPNVATSDAIVVVEGRSDVSRLLEAGIKNAIGVEGTDIPEEIGRLTQSRTTTVFFDGDRGGELLLKELNQIGAIDYVAVAPEGQSVEDLSRREILEALRQKVTYSTVENPMSAIDQDEIAGKSTQKNQDKHTDVEQDDKQVASTDGAGKIIKERKTETTEPTTVRDYVKKVIKQEAGEVYLLDKDQNVLTTDSAESAFGVIETADEVPETVILDGSISQRILDVAAQRGVDRIIGTAKEQYTKQPTNVRVQTADKILSGPR